MDGFKNPFDQNEGQQIIIISQPTISSIQYAKQISLPEKQVKSQKQLSQQTKILQQNVTMTLQQQGIIQPFQVIDQQIILMNNKQPKVQKITSGYEDPPLLQDIGIDPQLIVEKITSILKFQKPLHRYVDQTELFGPLIIAFIFGLMLMLSGKMHFGDIYALFVIGNFLIFCLYNFMSQTEIIPLYTVMSVIGYCLAPMLILSFLAILISLKNELGIILSLGLSVWSAYSATNYVQIMLKSNTNDRTALILYPLYLYYVSFAMITIF